MGAPGEVRKAWVAYGLPSRSDSPMTWPWTLMALAMLLPPSVPKLSVAGLIGLLGAVRNARPLLSPTTWPRSLIPYANDRSFADPDNVPRSSASANARLEDVRNAWTVMLLGVP